MITKQSHLDFEEQDNIELYNILPKDQIKRVFAQRNADLEPNFLGFVSIYKRLSEIIPIHFTVVDLGCGYNAQSFYFIKHKKYIAVDNFPNMECFISPNCVFYKSSIEEYLDKHLLDLDIEETFAICSYVPPWGGDNNKLVRTNFKNIFTYYPHGSLKTKT